MYSKFKFYGKSIHNARHVLRLLWKVVENKFFLEHLPFLLSRGGGNKFKWGKFHPHSQKDIPVFMLLLYI